MVIQSATSPIKKENSHKKGPPSSCIRRDSQGRFLGWIDYHHCLWDSYSYATAIWLDNSLSEDVVLEEQAAMHLRAMLDTRWVEGESITPKLRVRVKIDLPNTEHRFKLIFADNSDNPFNSAAPTDLVPNLKTPNSATGALRWTRFNTPTFKTDIDLGAKGIGPTDIYVRGQIRKVWALNKRTAIRGREIIRYGSQSHTYNLTDLDLEHLVDDNSMARFTNRFLYADESRSQGLQWFNAISLTHGWSSRHTMLTYGLGVSGESKPDTHQTNYGAWLTFRRSLWRDWLYYHIEPQINFPKDKNWSATPSLLVRLEVFFGDY